LALSERELELCGRLSLTPTVAECWKNTFLLPSDSTTCEQLENTTSLGLMSSAGAFRARTSATPASEQESTANAADSGLSMRESFANYDRATSSWRTSQLCLDGEWSEFSETWPKAGMTRNGKAYELKTLVPHTGENESGLLPTPSAISYGTNQGGASPDGPVRPSLETMARKNLWPTPIPSDVDGGRTTKGAFRQNEGGLRMAVKWPTPTGDDANNGTRQSGDYQSLTRSVVSNEVTTGTLNPQWVEWLMGFPLGYTDCGD